MTDAKRISNLKQPMKYIQCWMLGYDHDKPDSGIARIPIKYLRAICKAVEEDEMNGKGQS